MLAVSILDDQREVMEESPQLLQIFSDAIKGSRNTAQRVAAPTYSFSVCFCSQLLLQATCFLTLGEKKNPAGFPDV